MYSMYYYYFCTEPYLFIQSIYVHSIKIRDKAVEEPWISVLTVLHSDHMCQELGTTADMWEHCHLWDLHDGAKHGGVLPHIMPSIFGCSSGKFEFGSSCKFTHQHQNSQQTSVTIDIKLQFEFLPKTNHAIKMPTRIRKT